MKAIPKIIFASAIALSSVTFGYSQVNAAIVTENVYTEIIGNTVNLSEKAYLKISNLTMVRQDGFNTIALMVTIENGNNRALDLMDYWVKARTKQGASVSLKLASKDKTKKSVSPKTSEEMTFYGKVDTDISLKDLVFEVVKWDFSVPNYERKLGILTVPSNYNPSIPFHYKKIVTINGTPVKTYVERFSASAQEDFLIDVIFVIENAGVSPVNDPKYKFYLQSDSGMLYPLNSSEQEGYTIVPMERKTLALSGQLPGHVKSKYWTLLVAQEDEQDKLLVPVALYQLPSIVQNVNEEQKVSVYGLPFTFQLKDVQLNRYGAQITATIQNRGNKSLKLSNFKFHVVNEKKESIPLKTDQANVEILPNTNKEIRLVSDVWYDGANDIYLAVNFSGVKAPILVYNLNNQNANDNRLGVWNTFTNKGVQYQIMLEAVERQPAADADFVVAHFALKNPGSKALPVPAMGGTILFDGIEANSEVNITGLENAIALGVNEQIKFSVYTLVPYSFNFNNLDIQLYEKSEDKKKNLIKLSSNVANFNKYSFANNGVYRISDLGKTAEVSIRKVNTYVNSNGKLIYVELDYKNNEKRFADVAKLAAYFKTDDESYFPATLTETDQKISPQGMGLMSLWATVPSDQSVEDLTLVLGQKIATPDSKYSGIFKVASISLPDETTLDVSHINNTSVVSTSMSNLELQPYNVSFENIVANYVGTPGSISQLNISFSYVLFKKSGYDILPEAHDLAIEFVDVFSGMSVTQVIQSSNLQAGGVRSYTLTINDQALLQKLRSTGLYRLNIYDSYKGYNKLIASKVDWYWMQQNNF